jgi:hypothetical protein
MTITDLIFYFYLPTLGAIYLATLALILSGRSWGRLPHIYVDLILHLQRYFTDRPATKRPLRDRRPVSTHDPIIERDKTAKHRILHMDWLTTLENAEQSAGVVSINRCPNGGRRMRGTSESELPSRLLDTNLELIQQGIEAIVQVSWLVGL